MTIIDKRWRVGIGGIAIEASAFSPHRTTLGDFQVSSGDVLLARYPWMSEPWAATVDWVPLLHARALPGGRVEAGVYDHLRDELLGRTAAAGPFDGFLFDIHGAMSVEGLVDAEGDLATRLRAVLGPRTVVSASMDLHGNVSETLARTADLLTCYRTAPHEDTVETRQRAARNLVTTLERGRRPAKAWVTVPVLLPGEKTSTRMEPARSLYAQLQEVEQLDGVLDAAIWVGYAWADEPRCRAAVVVTGDDRSTVAAEATRLARAYWDARTLFSFVAPADHFDACMAAALTSDRRPFFISDSGDNPTAGGAGDVSYVLARMLETGPVSAGELEVLYASIVDPDAVAAAVGAGVGATVELQVGGRIDAGPQGPVAVSATVRAVSRDDEVGGDIAVLAAGGLRLIITSRRKPYHHIADFTALGLDPKRADVVIVKIGYLEPELYEAAADWMLALTPGGVDQDLPRLGHANLGGPVFPFAPDAPEPDLTALLLEGPAV